MIEEYEENKIIEKYDYTKWNGFYFNNEYVGEERVFTGMNLLFENNQGKDKTQMYIDHILSLPSNITLYEVRDAFPIFDMELIERHLRLEYGLGRRGDSLEGQFEVVKVCCGIDMCGDDTFERNQLF